MKSVAARTTLQMIEYSANIFIPEHVWNNPRFQKLVDLGDKHIFMVNDVMSFKKELKECSGDLKKVFNAVAIVSLLDNISIEKSMERVSEMIADIEKEILEIQNEFLTEENCLEVTKTFIKHFNYQLGGHHESYQLLDRY